MLTTPGGLRLMLAARQEGGFSVGLRSGATPTFRASTTSQLTPAADGWPDSCGCGPRDGSIPFGSDTPGAR